MAALASAIAFAVAAPGGANQDTDNIATPEGEPIAEEDPEAVALAKATAGLEPTTRRRWPTTFAGIWGSGSDPTEIHIAFTEGAETKVAELAEDFPRPDLLIPETAERSMAELEIVQDELIADRERVAQGDLELAGTPGPDYASDIDPSLNSVLVFLEEVDSTTMEAFTDRYGEAIVVRQEALPVPDHCDTRKHCEPYLRGGVTSQIPHTTPCSTAFVVRGPGGHENILSAGHCAGSPISLSDRSHSGTLYGKVRAQLWDGRVDAERHSIGNGFAGARRVFRSPSFKAWEIRHVSHWQGIEPGIDRVCKAGRNHPDLRCGRILGKNYTPPPPWPNGSDRYIRTDYCSGGGGDSGAAVIGKPGTGGGHWAYGIHSGSPDGRRCGDPNPLSIFGHIQYAANRLNVTVLTAP